MSLIWLLHRNKLVKLVSSASGDTLLIWLFPSDKIVKFDSPASGDMSPYSIIKTNPKSLAITGLGGFEGILFQTDTDHYKGQFLHLK